MKAKMIKAIFFDLGETLVTKDKQWIPGARATLSDLHQKGIRLGIISNTGNLLRPKILEMLPADFDIQMFEQMLVIFSSEAGVEKPDPQIFSLALSKAGIEATNCLFCTEDLVHTLVAQQLGFITARILPTPFADIAHLSESLIEAELLTP
jgi:FMN phosphatase YigB (HAD superfamily)